MFPKKISSVAYSSDSICLISSIQKKDALQWHMDPIMITAASHFSDDLSKELNESAVSQLCLARTTEVEAAIDTWSKGVKQTYTEKVRSLVFNLKKNTGHVAS